MLPPSTTSFTLFIVAGPGCPAAQIWPGQLLLGALLFLAYEPLQHLAILSWPIKVRFCEVETMGLRILGVSGFYVFVLSHDK